VSELAINGGIAGVVGLITLVLTRLFSRRDTAYENLARDTRNLRLEAQWSRTVIAIMDQELYDLRKAWAAQPGAGPLPPRKEWPPRPETVPEPAVSS
jgi:hypothetical protein